MLFNEVWKLQCSAFQSLHTLENFYFGFRKDQKKQLTLQTYYFDLVILRDEDCSLVCCHFLFIFLVAGKIFKCFRKYFMLNKAFNLTEIQ